MVSIGYSNFSLELSICTEILNTKLKKNESHFFVLLFYLPFLLQRGFHIGALRHVGENSVGESATCGAIFTASRYEHLQFIRIYLNKITKPFLVFWCGTNHITQNVMIFCLVYFVCIFAFFFSFWRGINKCRRMVL